MKLWGSSAPNGQVLPISDANYASGFYYLGNNPPTAEEFNWLFQQITQGIIDAGGFWQASKAYAMGNILWSSLLANSYKYFECTTAGTSGATEPNWGTVGTTVTDGTVVWTIRDVRDARNASTVGGKQATDFAPANYGVGDVCRDISNTNLNSAILAGHYVGLNMTNAPNAAWHYVHVFSLDSNHVLQVAYEMYNASNGQQGRIYKRANDSTGWSAWEQEAAMHLVTPAGYGIGENVDATHIVTLNSTTNKSGLFYYGNTDPNRPDNSDGQLLIQCFNSTSIQQTAFSWTGTIYHRKYTSGTWSDWQRIFTANSLADYVVAQQLGANGYTRWASGKLEQWGVLANVPLAETSPQTVTFNTPYNAGVVPNIVAGIAMASYVSGSISLYVTKGSITNTGFIITGDPSSSTSTGDIHWRSVG